MDNAFILQLARAATAQPEPEPEPEPRATALRFALAAGPGRVAVVQQDKAVGIGGVAWQACLALGHALDRDRGLFPHPAPARVLELGCGTALCGLCAWLLGAEEVVVTDSADCRSLVERSILETRESLPEGARELGAIRYAPLRWGQPTPAEVAGEWDLVLGSDLTYNEEDHSILLQTLRDVCTERSRVVLAHQRRPLAAAEVDPLERFISLAKESGFCVGALRDLPSPADGVCSGQAVPKVALEAVALVLTLGAEPAAPSLAAAGEQPCGSCPGIFDADHFSQRYLSLEDSGSTCRCHTNCEPPRYR